MRLESGHPDSLTRDIRVVGARLPPCILICVASVNRLTKADARRAMVRHHFSPCATALEVFQRLGCVQFDPIAPVGCNHDLVLQARVANYRIGDWQKLAYEQRAIYDGWDKQASLVPFEGWPVRRIYHKWHAAWYQRIFDEHPEAVRAILSELEERGPLLPKECAFQQRKEEWEGSWHGPNLSKQTLRALWHSGRVMTTGRRSGHHVYDLTERVVPPHLFSQPELSDEDALRELVLDRHRGVGLLRPNAQWEVWSFGTKAASKNAAIQQLVQQGELVVADVEGVKAHATPGFLELLDQPSLDPRVVFVAPLDPFVWDRKMIAHLFGFEYIWEIYVPEAKRRWGYYVLPVLYGDALVARVEFWCRDSVLTIRRWHAEPGASKRGFKGALRRALKGFMRYCGATSVTVAEGVQSEIREMAQP